IDIRTVFGEQPVDPTRLRRDEACYCIEGLFARVSAGPPGVTHRRPRMVGRWAHDPNRADPCTDLTARPSLRRLSFGTSSSARAQDGTMRCGNSTSDHRAVGGLAKRRSTMQPLEAWSWRVL